MSDRSILITGATGAKLVFWQHLTEIAIDHQNGVFAGTNDSSDHRGAGRLSLAAVC